MRIGRRVAAACAVVSLHASIASGQGREWTLADVLARARAHAPEIVGARLELDETRSRMAGATPRFQSNPEIDVGIGTRDAGDSRFTDLELGVRQAFEPGARRSARISGATAAIAERSARIDDTIRLVLREASIAYVRAVHAGERIRLLTAAQELAERLHAVADRRYKAGDIAMLDVNLTRATLARARAEREAAEADRAAAIGALKQLLLIDEDITVTGSLAPGAAPDLTALLASAAERPELRALAAGVTEAEASFDLGRAYARPDYGLGMKYAREEGDHILLGGFTLTLPTSAKGQELRAAGTARATRLRAALEAARARVMLEVRAGYDVHRRRLAAVRVLETEAMPGLDENDALATRSFDVGQIGLPDLLLIRRELLDTRTLYLDALLEAALARIDLDASAAILR